MGHSPDIFSKDGVATTIIARSDAHSVLYWQSARYRPPLPPITNHVNELPGSRQHLDSSVVKRLERYRNSIDIVVLNERVRLFVLII